MFVVGIEAIKLYLPPASTGINLNTKVQEVDLHTIDIMSSIERYKQEWTNLVQSLEQPELIRNLAFNRELKMSKLRSIYWAVLLRVLNTDHQSWHVQKKQQRKRYEKLKQEFWKNPRNIETPGDNPLSQSQQSVWNQYFSDQELYAVIRQDVVRTFPGEDFFRKDLIQTSMCNILFYYARENPYVCYRQGMHEILAPILFVIYSDHQSFLHFREITKMETDEILSDVLDPTYFEADSYSLFTRLMSLIEPYYRITNFIQNESGYFTPREETTPSTNAEVIIQLNFIRENILAKEDILLHNHLLKLEIPLHIFGIRWLRLLFGREFSFLDLLVVWDAIFADSDRFGLPNYILVSMLICIREKLLLCDQTECLTFLMRYPGNIDVNMILCHALHMMMPTKFKMFSNIYTKSELKHNSTKTTHAISSNVDIPKIREKVRMVQTRNAAEFVLNSRFNRDNSNADFSIIEGYPKNSPELILLELKNAQTVISIAHNKLQSYLSVIRKHTLRNTSFQLDQAIEGMEELCNFLDVKFMMPPYTYRTPVDEASEANEQTKGDTNTPLEDVKKCDGNRISCTTSKAGIEIRGKDKKCDLRSNEDSSPLDKTCNYEKPEECNVINSIHQLRNLREIELITFMTSEQISKRFN